MLLINAIDHCNSEENFKKNVSGMGVLCFSLTVLIWIEILRY